MLRLHSRTTGLTLVPKIVVPRPNGAAAARVVLKVDHLGKPVKVIDLAVVQAAVNLTATVRHRDAMEIADRVMLVVETEDPTIGGQADRIKQGKAPATVTSGARATEIATKLALVIEVLVRAMANGDVARVARKPNIVVLTATVTNMLAMITTDAAQADDSPTAMMTTTVDLADAGLASAVLAAPVPTAEGGVEVASVSAAECIAALASIRMVAVASEVSHSEARAEAASVVPAGVRTRAVVSMGLASVIMAGAIMSTPITKAMGLAGVNSPIADKCTTNTMEMKALIVTEHTVPRDVTTHITTLKTIARTVTAHRWIEARKDGAETTAGQKVAGQRVGGRKVAAPVFVARRSRDLAYLQCSPHRPTRIMTAK